MRVMIVQGLQQAYQNLFHMFAEFLPRFVPLATAPAPELALAAAALAEMLGGIQGAAARGGAHADAAPANPFATLGRWRHPGLD